jgi:hypothetical protein
MAIKPRAAVWQGNDLERVGMALLSKYCRLPVVTLKKVTLLKFFPETRNRTCLFCRAYRVLGLDWNAPAVRLDFVDF